MPRGADQLCGGLRAAGLRDVFGLPGSSNIRLFRAMQRAGIRAINTTSELAAAFAAIGYYRATRRVAGVVTIPGPGFTFALTGLAEARADSAALVHLVAIPSDHPDKVFRLQDIPHAAIASSIAKKVVDVKPRDDLHYAARQAVEDARAGEPGPVVVLVPTHRLHHTPPTPVDGHTLRVDEATEPATDGLARAVRAARRPVFLLGAGAAESAEQLTALAVDRRVPVLTTTSGRGIVPEDSPFALGFDFVRATPEIVNTFLSQADLILGLGCKLTHNGTWGFSIELPPEKLVLVNSDPHALDGSYPAAVAVRSTVASIMRGLEESLQTSSWTEAEVESWRSRFRELLTPLLPEPRIRLAAGSAKVGAFFSAFRAAFPRDGVLVTDSGHHQWMARAHYDIFRPSGLVTPADYQSMGFGIPAAIGAKVAAPDQAVAALVGDGGLLMTGMDLATAMREHIPIAVIVFADGYYGMIRMQQLQAVGREMGVQLGTLRLAQFAASLGVPYRRFTGDPETLSGLATLTEPCLIEVELEDSSATTKARFAGMARTLLRR
jgi:acetolactate synthase-1/2/3 large subunit